MFGSIRRHQKWLWIVIVFLTVVSFVYFWGNPNQNTSGRSQGRDNFGEIRGKEISREEYTSAAREVFIQYRLQHGEWPDKDPMAKQFGFDEQLFTYRRLLFIREQEDLNIRISDQAVAQMAANILHPTSDKGISLENFEKQILAERTMKLLDFENFLRHELGLQQLMSALGLAGKLVTPQEAEMLYRHENEEMSTEVAYFSASNHLAGLMVSSNGVAQFFQQRMADYKIPQRIQVNYVEFPLTNFLADADARLARVTNLAEVVESARRNFGNSLAENELKLASVTNLDGLAELIYRKRGGTNFYPEAKTADEAKGKIMDELRENEERLAARQKAAELADPLLSVDSPKPEMLSAVAVSNGLTVKVSAPFSLSDETNEFKFSPRAARIPFDLTPETPFAGPLDGRDAVYVIGLNKLFPSTNPPLENVMEKVTADFKFAQALEFARQAAVNFSRSFTNAPSPADFSTMCAAFKGDYLKVPPFSLGKGKLPPEVEARVTLGQLQNVAFTSPAGRVTTFGDPNDPRNPLLTHDGGFVLHMIARTPVDEKKMKEELPAFIATLRQTRQTDAFNEWFRKRISTEPIFQELTRRAAN